MNNWAGPKYMIAEGDTYMKYPDDETFPQLIVNYVKLDRVPKFNDGWTPVLDALRAGDYFVTSGEVLLRSSGIEGTGRAASTMRKPSGPSRRSSPNWSGATGKRWIGKSSACRKWLRSAAASSISRSMPPERNGSGSPCGIRPGTARSLSPLT